MQPTVAGVPIKISRGFNAETGKFKTPLEIPVADVEGMSMELFQSYLGRTENAHSHHLYATGVLVGATNWDAGEASEKDMFTKGLKESDNPVNTPNANPFNLARYHTNIYQDGRLDNGQVFVMYSLQFEYTCTTKPATYNAAGEITNPAPVAKPAGGYSAANQVYAITQNTNVTFLRGQDDHEFEDLAAAWPQENVISGSVGGDTDDGIFQNGRGIPRMLDRAFVFDWMDLWRVNVRAIATLAQPITTIFKIRLKGLLLDTRRG